MSDAGWGAVSWPSEYGGRGATVLEQLAFAEETTRARAPLPLNVIGLNNIGPAIMAFGTDGQKRDTAPPHGARGRHLVPGHVGTGGGLRPGVAAHARGAGRVRVRGERSEDVDVAGAAAPTGVSSTCGLIREAPKHEGISCLIVDMGLPGIEVRPLVTADR